MIRDYEALHAYVASHMRTPFAWDGHDCVTFCANGVRVQTGRDPLGEYRGCWKTARGATALLKRLGGMEAAVSLKLASIAPAMAQRGDVAGWRDPDGRIQLALVDGETLVGPGEHGLMRLPRSAMVCAWSAG